MADNHNLAFVVVFVFFVGISGFILFRLNQKENAPYMDEVFHIPQVQNYCMGKFAEWDPMITTLPGLYLTTIGVIEPLSAVLGWPIDVLCSTLGLRCINIGFSAGNLYVLYLLVTKLNGSTQGDSGWRPLLKALTLSLFPVLYFFTFLYYTDSGSTFCVLLMYLLSLHNCHVMAALMGAVGILFRQTNVIWVMFVAGLPAARILLDRMQPDKKDITMETMQGAGFLLSVAQYLWSMLRHNKKVLLLTVYDITMTTWSYMLVGLGFVCFVLINGSIVVGAKDDHQAMVHFPQLFYFTGFTAVFSLMHHVSLKRSKQFTVFLFRRPLVVVLFGCISYACIYKFTFAHRYLLADNRHYTFYVWAKIYQRHERVKYALIPAYLWASWSHLTSLEHKNILWKCIFILSISLNLVPSPLLEFRYFIIPYLIYRLNMRPSTNAQLILEFLLYVAVNAVTLYLFMEKPFQWEHVSGNQRFIW